MLINHVTIYIFLQTNSVCWKLAEDRRIDSINYISSVKLHTAADRYTRAYKMTNHVCVYLNRQEIDRPFVRLFRQRRDNLWVWWWSSASTSTKRSTTRASISSPFTDYVDIDVDADSQGKRIDVDYVCPKDQTEYTEIFQSAESNLPLRLVRLNISVYIPGCCHSN